MMRMAGRLGMAALGLTLLVGCNVNVTNPSLSVDVNKNGSSNSTTATAAALSCAAVTQGLTNDTVAANTPVAIAVTATGGTAPFKILGQAGNFNASTTLSRTYGNNTSSDLDVTDTVTILDSAGVTAQCDFDLSVTPATPAQALACTIAAPASPTIGASFAVSVSGQGGTSPYSFKNFSVGANGSILSALASSSATSAAASVRYSALGSQLISAQVVDAQNNVASCTQPVTVKGIPAVTLTATPSSANVGQTIALKASAAQFASAVTYAFTSSDSGVAISQNGSAAASASVVDGAAHTNVTITVTASDSNNESAKNTAKISFNQPVPPAALQCQVQHTASILQLNALDTFTVTATNGGAVTLSQVGAAGGSISAQTGNAVSISWSTSGAKTVSLQATETSTGRTCTVSDTINVAAPLTCSLYSDYNPAVLYQDITTYGLVHGGVGTVVLKNVVVYYGNVPYTVTNPYSTLGIGLQYQIAGSYPVVGTVQDSVGNTATCSMTQVVYY